MFTDDRLLSKLKQHLTIMPYKSDKEKLELAIKEIERLNKILECQ